jgi:hypothetical protein
MALKMSTLWTEGAKKEDFAQQKHLRRIRLLRSAFVSFFFLLRKQEDFWGQRNRFAIVFYGES